MGALYIMNIKDKASSLNFKVMGALYRMDIKGKASPFII